MVGGGRSLALESLVVSSAASCLILFFSYFVVFLQLYTRNKNKIEQRNLGRRGGGAGEDRRGGGSRRRPERGGEILFSPTPTKSEREKCRPTMPPAILTRRLASCSPVRPFCQTRYEARSRFLRLVHFRNRKARARACYRKTDLND